MRGSRARWHAEAITEGPGRHAAFWGQRSKRDLGRMWPRGMRRPKMAVAEDQYGASGNSTELWSETMTEELRRQGAFWGRSSYRSLGRMWTGRMRHPGKAESAASAGSSNGSHASMHACLAAVAGVNGGGRRRGPTVGPTARADGDGWRNGARRLQAAPGPTGPGGHSEGRGPRRGRELAGVAGGDDRREGRRR